jgi:hypothetical protein
MNRQQKRGIKSRERRKKYLRQKHIQGSKKKIVMQQQKVEDTSLLNKIRSFIYYAIRWFKLKLCLIGIHDYKLCSGLEGNSKYTCI